MADIIRILAQSNPPAAILTDAYTVDVSKRAVISSVTVCNRSANPTSFRIALAIAGASDSPEQYHYYDLPIDGNDTFVATIGITLGPTDVVRVYAVDATLSFNLSGVEV